MNIKLRKRIFKVFIYICYLLFLFWIIFPFVWVVSSSFMTERELGAKPPHWIPKEPVLKNYRNVMTGRFADAESMDGAYETARSILPNMFNSFYISFTVAVYNIVVGGMAAYAISRFKTRLNKSLYVGFIGSRVLPPMTMIIPLFVIFRKLQMIDTPWVLILSYNIFILPLSIWLLKAYFDKVPVEMEEMALIDGCNRFQVLLRIVVPVAIPGFIAVFIMAMMEGWSEFFYALVLTDQMTLPPVLISFRQMEQVNWNTLAAVAVLAVIPPVIFVLLLQKYIISGLTSGAVKG